MTQRRQKKFAGYLKRSTRSFLVSLALALVATSSIQALTLQHDPVRVSAPEAAINIEFYASEINKITIAAVFARKAQTGDFVRFPMIGSGRVYKGEIPSYIAQKIGVEYYIEATTTDGAKVTYPASNPSSNPVRVKITQDSVNPVIRIIEPIPKKIVSDTRPLISVSFKGFANVIDIRTVKVTLDGVDVSANAKIRGTFAQYRPPMPLAKGKHSVSVSAKDIAGTGAEPASWDFYVLTKGIDEDGSKDKKEEKEWKTQGNISSQYQYAKMDSVTPQTQVANPNGYATASIDFKATNEDNEISLGPLFFTTQETNDQQPAQNFSFGYSNNRVETKWGSISAQLTSMSGGGGGVHGGEFVYYTHNKKDKSGARVQLTGGRTRQAVEASDNTFGVGTLAQRIYAVKTDYFATKNLEFYGAAMDVRDVEESLPNREQRGLIEPLKNQAVAFGFKMNIKNPLFDSFDGEIGYSNADIKNPDDSTRYDNFKDFAFKFSTGRNFALFASQLKVDYSHYRPDFLFLFGGAGSDSQDIGLSLSNTFGPWVKTSTSYKWQTDNLSQKKDATTTNNNISLNLTLSIPNLPPLTLSGTGGFQQASPLDEEENADLASKNQNYSANASTNFNFPVFGIQSSSSVSYALNMTVSNTSASETRNMAHTGTAGLNMSNILKFLTLALNFSLNASEVPPKEPETMNSYNISENWSLSLTPTFGSISLPLSFTLARTYETKPGDFAASLFGFSSPDAPSADNLNFGASFSFAYALFQTHKLSLAAGYTDYIDKINETSNYKQYTLTLSYNTQF